MGLSLTSAHNRAHWSVVSNFISASLKTIVTTQRARAAQNARRILNRFKYCAKAFL